MVTSHKMNESEMGYRGSKSDIQKMSVKEQRVDGSCFENYSKLRCTLTGFERSYQVNIPSKQTLIQTRNFCINSSSYSTDSKSKLNP
jgi:hypothetical protein